MIWARVLALSRQPSTRSLRNEYLTAENRILRARVKGRLLLSPAEKATLAEIAHRIGRKALDELAAAARPDTKSSRSATKVKGTLLTQTCWDRPAVPGREPCPSFGYG
jgi:hypothetical protein